jgi:hypothetical protein
VKKTSTRLSREELLHRALNLLVKEEKVKLHIDSIVTSIGLT